MSDTTHPPTPTQGTHVNPYQQLDNDLLLIEQFGKKLNNPELGLGSLLQEWVEDVEPAYQRAISTLGQWGTKFTNGDNAHEPDPDDDTPF